MVICIGNGLEFASGQRLHRCSAAFVSGRGDRNIENNVDSIAIKIIKYRNDFLVFVRKCDFKQSITTMVKTFHKCIFDLQFTHEVPSNNQLQFLDVNLKLTETHVGWT